MATKPPTNDETTAANDNRPPPYRPNYAIVVACEDEAHQIRLYARLQRLGFAKLRVLVA